MQIEESNHLRDPVQLLEQDLGGNKSQRSNLSLDKLEGNPSETSSGHKQKSGEQMALMNPGFIKQEGSTKTQNFDEQAINDIL